MRTFEHCEKQKECKHRDQISRTAALHKMELGDAGFL